MTPSDNPTGNPADPGEKLTRSEQKHRDIVAAAQLIFLEKGFDSAGMDEIADRAGVSKRTVYSHFGSKEDMFVALLEMKCGSVQEDFVSTVDETAPIEASLHQLGRCFLKMIFQPETLQMFRILAAQADNFPDLGRRFFENGPQRSSEVIGRYLEGQKQRGVIDIGDPMFAAGILISSMMHKRLIACLLNAAELPDEAEREHLVRTAVSIFLEGVRRR